MLRRLLWLLPFGIGLLTACQAGVLVVDPVATSVQRPSQVAVYLSVRSGDEPLTNLTGASFSLSEDGQRLDPAGVSLSLLERDVAAEHRTVLLLDASSLKPGAESEAIARAAEAFVRKVMTTQAVSVYAFDGSEALRPLGGTSGPIVGAAVVDAASGKNAGADEPGDGEPVKEKGDNADSRRAPELEVAAASTSDPSRDLNGAVLRGLAKLDEELSRSEKPVRVGTLVVFTRGADLAGRVSAEQLRERLNEASAAVILIRGGGLKDAGVERMGRDGVVDAPSLQRLDQAFAQAADRALAIERSHYLLAYCSPARAGERTLRIEVQVPGSGTQPVKGALRTRFDARGFSSGCDPRAKPRFVVTLVSGRHGSIPAALPDGVEPPAPGAPQPEQQAAPPAPTPEEAAPPPPKPKAKPRPRPAPPPPPSEAPAAPPKAPPASPPPQDFEP